MTPNDTLAELAVRIPAASRVFRRHRLDYCCSGNRPLAEACRERGLDPDLVFAELEAQHATDASDVPTFDGSPVDVIIEHIVSRYHDGLREELPQLVAMAKRVEHRHGDKEECPQGLADHLARTEAELREHLAKEERVLFPMIRAGANESTRGPISVMAREHEDHGTALRINRELTGDLIPPAVACATWRALYLRLVQLETDLMDHIHIENNILFPRVMRSTSDFV